MNRLKKKCVIATVGIHLLLLVILFVGPAFFNSHQKPDDTQVLDVIPANLIDAAFNNGVKNATPPAPTPVVPQPPQPQPRREFSPPPKPAEQTPSPSIVEKVEKLFKSEPVKPAPKKRVEKTETHPHKIEVNTKLVTRNAPKNSENTRNTRAVANAIKNLRQNFSKATEINLSGSSSAAYANYGDVVVSVYHNAWVPPDGMAGDNVTVKFKVTISRDGTVISARIVTPSGDANVDRAVQRMLDRVTFIAPFPDGATDTERNYTINFNATKITE